MRSIFKLIIPLIIVLFNINYVVGQVKPSPEKDEMALSIYVHGINSKLDIEKAEKILKNESWVKFVQVERFPQKETQIIIKKTTTPEMINNVLKPLGFFIINKSFSDNQDTEKSLFESRKINGYKPEPRFD